MARRNIYPLTLVVIASLVAACSGGAASPSVTAPSATATPAAAATQNQSSATQGSPTQGAATTPGAASTASANEPAGAIHLDLVADGTQARYRVREQLAELSFPSDAIGKTSAVTGSIVINSDGSIVPNLSKWVVDVTTLVSDKGQRDRFVQRNLLQTDQYPTAEFDLTGASGLASPLPTAGPLNFQVSGNLTAHGVTKPATWTVTGQILSSTEMTGTATTSFKFEDYGIQQPSVPVVLSVVDKITLEIDFHLKKAD